MENKITDSQKNGIQKKNEIAINFAKGGSIGIGVGIILVGGALLVNAFHKKKPPQKPVNKNHETPHSSQLIQHHLISDETETETETEKEKANGSSDSREIYAQKLFVDGNHKFEGNHGKDDQEISSCSKDSEDHIMEGNGYVVQTKRSPSLPITNSDINGISIELPRRSAMIETTEVDHGTEENHQIEEHEDNCCANILETSKEADLTMVSSIEVSSGLIDDDQESESNGNTVKHGQDDDIPHLEQIEDSKINEIHEATHESDSNNNAEIFESEKDEKVCSHIKEEEINRSSEADEGDEVLITSTIQPRNETQSKGNNQPGTILPEEKTAQLDDAQITEDHEAVQIDAVVVVGGEIDVQDANNGLLTTGDGGVSDKFELVDEPNTKMQLETLEFEEKEAQFDAQTKAAEVDSRSEQTSKLIECQVMQPHAPRFEEEEAQYHVQLIAAGDLDEDKEAQNSAPVNATEEAIEDKENDENISSTLDHESIEATIGKINDHDPLVQSTEETQLIYQESEDLSLDHQATSITEGESQAVIVDNVTEISEVILNHFKDKNEKPQENEEHVAPQEKEIEIHYKINEDVIISSKSLESVKTEKGISNMNFLMKYERMSFLMRQKGPIVIGTLLWPLFYCYFGLPFLKICLVAVLIMVLSKINGF